jgi:hypothetical protein
MTNFKFEDFVRTTFGEAVDRDHRGRISEQQLEAVIDYLKSPGSGPDAATSYQEFVERKLRELPVELEPGKEYVAFSGRDASNRSNYLNARDYTDEISPKDPAGQQDPLKRKAGIIEDTPYGSYVDKLDKQPGIDAEFTRAEQKLNNFLKAARVEPWGDNAGGALRDVMWNAGSPKFFENAIASGKPLVAFVENAPLNRGFSNFELATALEHPDLRINGYPVSRFGPEPLEFVRQSAAEYRALEKSLAASASVQDGVEVTVESIRKSIKPIDGYDALQQTLYDRPVADYKSLGLSEMAEARSNWIASGGRLATVPHVQAQLPEHLSRTAGEPGSPRGPPSVTEDMPHAPRASIDPALKAGGVAGLALLAHDFGTSGHKWVELYSQGNSAGAYSTAAHFVGRNVGGAFGGFVAGAGVGLTTGSWTGPGAIITGIGGGALGAYLGERWADQKDIDHIYKQEDPLGRTWTRNPADPEGRWMRGAHQQQVQGSDLGTGPEVRPVQTALGDDVTFRADYVATGTLERQLNWQAARASYELGLKDPPAPKDPYRLSAANMDGPRGAFESGRDFVRDPRTQQWELEIRETIDGRAAIARHEPVSAERAQALDEQSRAVIAQNAANTPAAMAARYMVAYEQGRWSDFGDKENPSIPTAIQKARDSADTLVASDGDKYTRQADGQWIHNGTFLDASANANVRQELETMWKSQQAGVEELGAVAAEIKATTAIAHEGVRGQVDALYAKHGIERTEEQLAATATAVEQSLGSEGRVTDLTLELVPDARTRQPGADSAIAAFTDPGNNVLELRGTTTPDDVARVLAQQSLRAPDSAPLPDALDLRIDALSPQQWEAHQQALREANRQGASTEEALQAATLAAQQAGAPRPGPVQEPQPVAEVPRPQAAQSAEPTPAQRDAVTSAAAQAAAIPVAADARKEQADAKAQPATQEPQPAAAEATRERTRQEEARVAEREATAKQDDARREPLVREAQPVTQPVPDIHAAQAHAAEAATPPAPATTAPPAAAARVSDDWERPAATLGQESRQPASPALDDKAHERRHTVAPQTESAEQATLQQATVAEVHREERPAVERGTDHAVPSPRAEHTPEPIVFEPDRQAGTARTTAPAEPVAPPESLPTTHADPRDPEHPDHHLYQQVREHVSRLDASHGRQYDELSERLTGSLMVLAKSNNLTSVDHVVLSKATPNAGPGENVFVVQGELDNPGHKRAAMQTEAAVTAPFEQSQVQLEELSQQEQAKAQVVTDQQRELDERVQREMNPPLRMG